MKKTLSLLLMLSLLLSALSPSALATVEEVPEEQPPIETTENAQDNTSSEVTSLAELLSAIEAAQDGDTIVLGGQITIDEKCVVGDIEKRITLVPSDSFTLGAFFKISNYPAQSIVFQNLIMDGQGKTLSAINANSIFAKEISGTLTVYNVHFKNFASNISTISIHAMDAVFDTCHFEYNTAKRCAGIESSSIAELEVKNSIFDSNTSTGNGAAIRCAGTTKIINTVITNNTTDDDDARIGGGISIENSAYCEITDCKIIGNIADLGGGICIKGTAIITDTLLYGNTGKNGASDIYTLVGSKLVVDYPNGLSAVYTENDPIGFYADYFGIPFDVENNAVFLGETLNVESTESFYGVRFVFAADLPEKDNDSPEQDTIPTNPPTAPEVPTEPQEPEIPVVPEVPNKQETPTPPVEDDTDDEEDITPAPAPVRPSRPNYIYIPSVAKEEEQPKVVLSCGGATLDIAIPLALAGYGDGQLHEDDPITRAQIAVLLYRSLTDESKSTLAASTSIFADVENGVWYYDAVSALSAAGIIGGYNGLYNPNDNLTWGQLIALLTRFVEPKTAEMPQGIAYSGHWAHSNIETAAAYGWIDDAVSIVPDHNVTRGEAVEFVNSIFESC